MPLKLNSTGGGSVTLQEPSTASNRTLTLPDNTGTVISTASTGVITQAMMASGVAGNGPAFGAYRATTNQTISAATWTKVQLNGEYFDTANCFDNTTNYRFTPNVAGYYLFNATLYGYGSTNTNAVLLGIYKNGSRLIIGAGISDNSAPYNSGYSSASGLLYMNGSTDYTELFAYISGSGTPTIVYDVAQFDGVLIRGA